ncbi:hypothetical protein BS329_13555, partial [Amycolatopsis coloradensis]
TDPKADNGAGSGSGSADNGGSSGTGTDSGGTGGTDNGGTSGTSGTDSGGTSGTSGTGGTNNADGNGGPGTGSPEKDKGWLFGSKEKIQEQFLEAAKKYDLEHPGAIKPGELQQFEDKLAKFIKYTDGTPAGLKAMGFDEAGVDKMTNIIKTFTDPNHSGTALLTKSTIDMIRGAVLPGVAAGEAFPDEWRGKNASGDDKKE